MATSENVLGKGKFHTLLKNFFVVATKTLTDISENSFNSFTLNILIKIHLTVCCRLYVLY